MSTGNHETTQGVLEAVDAGMGAGEAHGMLCGMLSGPGSVDRAHWIAEVLAESEPRGEAARACLETLSLLYDETVTALGEEDFQLEPLVPDDTHPLAERTRALAAWCRGFLFGIGYTEPGRSADLPAEVREALADLSEIARVASEPDEAEDDEDAWSEVHEYVRVAALLCREHLAGAPDRDEGARSADSGDDGSPREPDDILPPEEP